jgi:hypothetical protein
MMTLFGSSQEIHIRTRMLSPRAENIQHSGAFDPLAAMFTLGRIKKPAVQAHKNS